MKALAYRSVNESRLVDPADTRLTLNTLEAREIDPGLPIAHHVKLSNILDSYDASGQAGDAGAPKAIIETSRPAPAQRLFDVGPPTTALRMRKVLSAATMTVICLVSATARAAPPDTSSMPQLDLPQATPVEVVSTLPIFMVTATAASNYTFRGISQTENQGALFGSGRVSYDDFYAGVGVENVDFHNSTAAEYDLSAGWTPKVNVSGLISALSDTAISTSQRTSISIRLK